MRPRRGRSMVVRRASPPRADRRPFAPACPGAPPMPFRLRPLVVVAAVVAVCCSSLFVVSGTFLPQLVLCKHFATSARRKR